MPVSRRQKLPSDTMDDWCNSNFSGTALCLRTAPPLKGSHAKDCQTNVSVGEEIMLAMLLGDWGGALKRLNRERVLFIGTQFSILYTSMYSPAEAATPRA
jgi:hypothetical protein